MKNKLDPVFEAVPEAPQTLPLWRASFRMALVTVAGLPADLLGRRADIAAARWRIEASSKDVVHAKIQFYPSINLVAFTGFSSIGLNRMLDSGRQHNG